MAGEYQIDFTDEKLRGAEVSLARLYNTLYILEDKMQSVPNKKLTDEERELEKKILKLRNSFIDSMNEDFNTPNALTALYEMSKTINKFINENKTRNSPVLKLSYETFLELGKALGFFQQKKRVEPLTKKTEDLIKLLLYLREKLRDKKEYELSDEIRTRMKKLGLKIEDTSEGTRWKIS